MDNYLNWEPEVLRLLEHDVYVTGTGFLRGDFFETAKALVSAQRRTRVARIKQRERAEQSLAAELLLRFALQKSGFSGEPLFAETDRGKPYLLNEPRIFFSLSHTRNLAVCAVSADCEIGVDAELLRDVNTRAVEKYCTQCEREIIASTPENERREKVFDIWTRKESLYKAHGGEIDVRGFDVYDGSLKIGSARLRDYMISLCLRNGK